MVAKEFMDKREGKVLRFSVEKFLSHSAEKIRRGTLYGVTDFGYREILCLRGLCHDFSSKFFCLTVPKQTFRRGTLLCCVSEKFW